jgi:hypothetical protein
MIDKMIQYIIILSIMKMIYKPPFRKFVKKQTRPTQLAVEDEIERISDNPAIGEVKLGDLGGIQVHKFEFQRQTFLIAYRVAEPDIVFYSIGTHENFYRDLKRYLKGAEKSDYS